MACGAEDRAYFERLLVRLDAIGMAPVVCVGGGEFLESLCPRARDSLGVLAGVIDDDARKVGGRWAGLDVLTVEDAVKANARAAVLTADEPVQTALFEGRRRLLEAGMRVLTVPKRFKERPWDRLLIDLFEHRHAREKGIALPWAHDYPRPEHEPPTEFVDAVRAVLPDGGVVCEIGQGEGMMIERIIDRASLVHAVDFSARLLFDVVEYRFRERLDRLRPLHDETAALSGIADGSVDLVYSVDVFVHIPIDLTHQYLRAIKRVLKPTGSALIHFRAWEGDEPAHWEANHWPYAVGRPSAMCYNSLASLGASCDAVGLRVEAAPEAMGETWRGYVARFVHA